MNDPTEMAGLCKVLREMKEGFALWDDLIHQMYVGPCPETFTGLKHYVKEKRMRLFYLERTEDVSGTSGIGRVAEGVEFSDGTCALRWLTEHRSTAVYASLAELEAIHGHEGKTRVVFATMQPDTGGMAGKLAEMQRRWEALGKAHPEDTGFTSPVVRRFTKVHEVRATTPPIGTLYRCRECGHTWPRSITVPRKSDCPNCGRIILWEK